MCDTSQVSHEKAEKGVAFLSNFQESLFLAWINTIGT